MKIYNHSHRQTAPHHTTLITRSNRQAVTVLPPATESSLVATAMKIGFLGLMLFTAQASAAANTTLPTCAVPTGTTCYWPQRLSPVPFSTKAGMDFFPTHLAHRFLGFCHNSSYYNHSSRSLECSVEHRQELVRKGIAITSNHRAQLLVATGLYISLGLKEEKWIGEHASDCFQRLHYLGFSKITPTSFYRMTVNPADMPFSVMRGIRTRGAVYEEFIAIRVEDVESGEELTQVFSSFETSSRPGEANRLLWPWGTTDGPIIQRRDQDSMTSLSLDEVFILSDLFLGLPISAPNNRMVRLGRDRSDEIDFGPQGISLEEIIQNTEKPSLCGQITNWFWSMIG